MSEPVSTASMYFTRRGAEAYTSRHLSKITETLEYYTNQQGGITTKKNVLTGVRVGSENLSGDLIDGRHVCTGLSGPANKVKTVNSRKEMAKNALKSQHRVGFITEGTHRSIKAAGILFPEPENYALLGAYVLVDAWWDWVKVTNKDKKVVWKKIVMSHFYKEDNEGIWWDESAPEGTEEEAGEEMMCDTCNRPMMRRYVEGAIFCGRLDCDSSDDGSHYATLRNQTRTYAPSFLNRELDMATFTEPFELVPPIPSPPADKKALIALVKKEQHPGWRGWVCPDCKRFNCRISWLDYTYRNCGYLVVYNLPDMTLDELVDDFWLNVTTADDLIHKPGMKKSRNLASVHQVSHFPHDLEWEVVAPIGDRYVVVKLDLKNEDGDAIYLGVATKHEIDREGGIRDQFRDQFRELWSLVQARQRLRIERRLMKKSQGKIGKKTAQFSVTLGIPYSSRARYDAEGAIVPIDDGPEVLTRIQDDYLKTVAEVVGVEDVGANSHLLLAYCPKMKMNYHQDNEPHILNDIISSIFFGGLAVMDFGVKKDKTSRVPTKVFSFPLPGTGSIMIQKGKGVNKLFFHKSTHHGLARLVSTARGLQDVQLVSGLAPGREGEDAADSDAEDDEDGDGDVEMTEG